MDAATIQEAFGRAVVINFYSPTEDVLVNATSGIGGAWPTQEILKGSVVLSLMPRVAFEGGWGFNREHTVPLAPDELLKTEFSEYELKTSPPFKPFADDWLHSTNSLTLAQVDTVLRRVLADGIPATTFAASLIESLEVSRHET